MEASSPRDLVPQPAGLPSDRSDSALPADGRPAGQIGPAGASAPDVCPPLGEEVDLWWGSYAGRTMLPSFVVCGFVTAIILGLSWYFRVGLGVILLSYAGPLVLAPLWVFQVGRWAYRLIATNYRLTTRRLLCARGFYRTANWELDLARVTGVAVERGPLQQPLDVGQIVIRTDREGPFILEGVLRPESIAQKIQKRVRQVKEGEN
jgi:membrane protein YdbS with pleckstrin-like domain